MKKYTSYLFILTIVLCSSCNQIQQLNPVKKKSSAYTSYYESLQAVNLANSNMGKTWFEAGEKALNDSLRVAPPYRETGYFRAEAPAAYGFSFYLKEGQTCEIDLRVQPDSMRVFLELFEKNMTTNIPKWSWVKEIDAQTNQLEFIANKTGFYHLRLQAELLATGSYELDIRLVPSISFPVLGGKNHDIGGFWGDPRSGRRKHKGVDIFAKKGTPVLATGPGTVSRVRTGGLGGKTVWVRDDKFGHQQYFAHLDEQLVTPGQSVTTGDTLGTVGNTGNALKTPPHLHYGIYKSSGPVDPLPFLYKERNKFSEPNIDLTKLGNQFRIGKRAGKLYKSPYKKGKVVQQLNAHTPVHITGGAEGYYRVITANGHRGFIKKREIVTLEKPIKYFTTKQETAVLYNPDATNIPIATLPGGERVAIVGRSKAANLIRTREGILGWVRVL